MIIFCILCGVEHRNISLRHCVAYTCKQDTCPDQNQCRDQCGFFGFFHFTRSFAMSIFLKPMPIFLPKSVAPFAHRLERRKKRIASPARISAAANIQSAATGERSAKKTTEHVSMAKALAAKLKSAAYRQMTTAQMQIYTENTTAAVAISSEPQMGKPRISSAISQPFQFLSVFSCFFTSLVSGTSATI